jgi:adenine-specific DNA-methyltransferase
MFEEEDNESIFGTPMEIGKKVVPLKSRRRRRQESEYDGDLLSDAEIRRGIEISDITKHINSYSAANYIGNKREIAEQIIVALDKHAVAYDSVFDAFSGSGVVSLLFALLGKKVICNDLLTSSSLQAACLLNADAGLLTEADWMFLTHNKPTIKTSQSIRTIYHNSEKLLTPEEIRFLDDFRANLIERFGNSFVVGKTSGGVPNLLSLDGYPPQLDKANVRIALALYGLVMHINSHCFVGGRYYNGQTLAKLEHRLAHQQNGGLQFFETLYDHTAHRIQFPCPLRSLKNERVVYNGDIVDLLKSNLISADLLYLDPPYGGDASDYVYKYQFLEEYIHGKKLSDGTLSGGSRFDKKKGYAEEFRNLLSLCGSFPSWLISFNATSFAKLDDIKSIVKEFRSEVEVEDVAKLYKYRKERTMATDREFLILARNKK